MPAHHYRVRLNIYRGEAEILAALDWAEAELNQAAARPAPSSGEPAAPRTLAEGLRLAPEAGLVMISVPGAYAYAGVLVAPTNAAAARPAGERLPI